MISLLCPTRGRPLSVARLATSIRDTASGSIPVELICYVDDDDAPMKVAVNTLPGIKFVVGPRMMLSEYWNELTKKARFDLIMLAADDMVFRTHGWDELVIDIFAGYPDRILLVHGDDLGPNGKSFATLPIVSRRWIETIGYFTPPGFPGDFADTWLNDVADMIGRKVLAPFVVEHMHHIWRKAQYDQTYKEKDIKQRLHNSPQVYVNRLNERQRDAAKLKAVMIDETTTRRIW